MIYFLCILTGLALILLQSLVLGVFLPSGLAYDLMIPLVVYLSLFHPDGKALFIILLMGLIMDGITGGAMGIYMLTYFWIFTGTQLVVHFLQKESPVLIAGAIVLGVLLESLFIVASGVLSGKSLTVWSDMTGVVIGRLVTAGVTGPLLIYVFRTFFKGMAA